MIDFSAGIDYNPKSKSASREITPLDAAKDQLIQFRAAVNAMQREATELAVTDAASESKAGEMTAQVKSLSKKISAQQDALISEPQRFVKSVQAFTLPFRKDLESIEGQLKRKLGDYGYKKEMERRKAEAAAQKATAEAQKKIDREAKKAGVDPVQLPAMVVPQESEPIRTESGTTSFVPVWDFELLRIEDVPHKYLMIDERAIRTAIRSGIMDIPGLKILEKMQVRVRTA